MSDKECINLKYLIDLKQNNLASDKIHCIKSIKITYFNKKSSTISHKFSFLNLKGSQGLHINHSGIQRRPFSYLLKRHAHYTNNKGRSDHKIPVLRFYDKSIGEKLLVTNVDTVMTINVFVEKTLVLSDIEISLVCHFRQPDVLPACSVVALNIFKEKPDVHEDVQMVLLLYLVVLLRVYNKQLVFRTLRRQDMQLRVVQGGFYYVQLVGGQRGKPEVTYLMHLSGLLGLYWQGCCLEIERQVECLA